MNKRLFFVPLLLLTLMLVTGGIASAAPDSVLSLTILPDPATAGETVSVNWDSDTDGAGTVTFRAYIPADWYDSADWKTGTGVSASNVIGGYTVSACTDATVGSITLSCAQYSSNAGAGQTIESFSLSFTLDGGATVGTGRPVRVTHNAGSAGTPNISTVYVEVTGTPSTRYISDTAGCGGNSPCDTGVTALADAIAALPAAGGTIVVYNTASVDGDNAIGSKDIIIEGSGTPILQGSGSCTSELIELDGTGDLTVDGLTIDGTGSGCDDGIYVTGSGNLTGQNSAVIQDWFDTGIQFSGATGSGHLLQNITLSQNDFGITINASPSLTIIIQNSTISHHTFDGLVIGSGTVTIIDSLISNNSYGVYLSNTPVVSLKGNEISNNLDYGLAVFGGSTVTAYANEFSGNNGGGYQALVNATVAAAKNWWGSSSDDSVGPTSDGATSYADGWNARLGSDVESYADGEGSVTLGSATLTGGSDTAVIINLGSFSAEAPFGNGVAPYVNLACSDFYDFYGVDNPAGWTVGLPVNTGLSGCITNVIAPEVAYTIEDTAECTTASAPDCWDLIDPANITTDGNSLFITGLTLDGTHLVAGESSEGADPTAVLLTDIGLSSAATLPTLLWGSVLLLVGGTAVLLRRRQII